MVTQELGPLMKRRLYTINDNRETQERNLEGIEDSSIEPNENDVLITIPQNEKVLSSIYKYFNDEWIFQTELSYPTIQGDWDQHDSTAPDYIKNKPNVTIFEESVNELINKVDNVFDLLDKSMIININGVMTDTGFRINGERNNNTISYAEIPFVSSTKAGIFTSEDYQNLNNILSWNAPGGKFKGIFTDWESVPNAWNSPLWYENKIFTGDYFIVKDYLEQNVSSLFIITNDWKTSSNIGKENLIPAFNFTQELDYATTEKAGLVKSSNNNLEIKFTEGIGTVNNLPQIPHITFIGDEIDIPISPSPPENDEDLEWYVQYKQETIFDDCIKELIICTEEGENYGNIYEVK